VDDHNQAQQHELGLEETWATHDCWFCLNTTFLGVVVTDMWKAVRASLKPPATPSSRAP
jgi:hypothetical protein